MELNLEEMRLTQEEARNTMPERLRDNYDFQPTLITSQLLKK